LLGSVNYALALQILAAVEIGNSDFESKTWQVYLLTLLLLFVNGLLTMNSTKFLSRLGLVGTWVNLFAVIIFCIWLPVGAKGGFNSNAEVCIDLRTSGQLLTSLRSGRLKASGMGQNGRLASLS
jgi:amino acid transporter